MGSKTDHEEKAANLFVKTEDDETVAIRDETKTERSALVMNNVTPGERLPRRAGGRIVGKIYMPLKRVQPSVSSPIDDFLDLRAMLASSPQPKISPTTQVNTNNNTPTITMEARQKIIRCKKATFAKANFDDKEKAVIKLVLYRLGKVPDRTINTAEFEVPWKDYECVFGLATQDEDDTRASRFFAYKPETTLYLEELVEIVGARPPVISWSDEEELENEGLIRSSGGQAVFKCDEHPGTEYFFYHITYWRGNQLEGN